MVFKVGEKVKVKPDIKEDRYWYWVLPLAGRIGIVVESNDESVSVKLVDDPLPKRLCQCQFEPKNLISIREEKLKRILKK